MNEEYLKGLHSYLEIEDDYDTWVSSISNNDEYLKGLHKYLEIEDDYDVWNSSVFGSKPVSNEIEEVEIPVEETQEPVEEVETIDQLIIEPKVSELKSDQTFVDVPVLDQQIKIDETLFPKEKKKIVLEEENVSDENRIYEKDILYIDKKSPITPEIRQTDRGNFYLKQGGKNYKLIRTDDKDLINFDPLQGREVVDMPETTKEIVQSDLLKNERINQAVEQDTDYGKEPAWKQLGYESANDYYEYIADEDEGSKIAYKGLAPIGYMLDKEARITRTIARIGKGFKNAGDLVELNKQNLLAYFMGIPEGEAREAYLDVFRNRKEATDKPIDDVIDFISEFVWDRDYTIVEAIEKGNVADAADMVVGGVLESSPYMLLAMTGWGGIAAIGASATGSKFDELEDDEENRDEALSTITLNSIGSGALEATFELVTRGLWRKARGLLRGGNKEAAEELVKSYGKRLLERLALEPGAEGVSEAATEFSTDLLDFLTLDKFDNVSFSKWFNARWRSWADAGIIGVGSGELISNTGRLTSDKESIRNAAETVLTPESDKKVINDAALKINKLNEELKKAYDKESIRTIEVEILKEEAKIINTKKKVSEELNLMNEDELKLYAKNKDQINTYKSRLKSKINIPFVEKKTKEEIEKLEIENEKFIREAVDRRLDENIKTVGVEDLGRTVNDYNSKEEYQKAYNNTEQGKKNSMNVTSSDGFISEDGDIYVNREVAQKVRNVNVAAHELLHGILNNNIKEPGQLKKLVNEFKAILPRDVADLIQKRIDDNYRFETDEQGNRVERPESEYMEEYFTALADLIGNRQIKFNENIFTKIGEKITPIFKGKGYGHIKFETGKDVYNFIKDYQKQIAKGELKPETIEAARKIAEQDVKMSKTASDKVQEIYNDQGVAGALDIIQEFKPIVNKIVERRREAPGFDRQLLIDEIETGERGILDLIQAYDPKSGVPLAAYVNKFLPSRAIEASKRVLGEVFEGDIAERVDIAEPTTAVEEVEIIEKPKAPVNLRRALDIEKGSDLYNKVKDVVAKTFGTRIPSPTDPKFKKFLQDAYATELTNDVKELMGKPSSDKYKTFLQKYGEQIYDLIPQDILNKSYQDFIIERKRNLSPTEVDDAISKGLLPSDTPRTAGPSLFTKKPYNQEEFVEFHLAPKKGRPASKQTQLAQTIAKELGKDATLEVLEDPKVFERFTEVQEIEGKKVTKETKPKVAEKIQREPGVKFSITNKKVIESYQKIAQAKDINKAMSNINVTNVTITNKNRSKKIISNLNFIKKGKIGSATFELAKLGNFGRDYEYGKITNGSFVKKSKLLGGKKYFKTIDGNYILSTDKKANLKYDGKDKITNWQPSRGSLFYGKTDPNYIEALEAAKKNDSEPINKKLKQLKVRKVTVKDRITSSFIKANKNQSDINMDALELMALNLQEAVHKYKMPIEDAALFLTSGYQATSGILKIAAPFKYVSKVFEYAIIGKTNQKTGRKFREEHNPPASVVGASIILAIKNNQVKDIFPFIRKNYYQTQLSKADDALLDIANLDSTLPEGTSILDNPIKRLATAGINLNTIINPLTNKNIAEENGYGVPKGFDNMPDLSADQNKAILSKENIDKKVLKNNTKFSKSREDSRVDNIENIKNSKVILTEDNMTNEDVINKAATLDNALANARKLDAPVKKIRVFDFDDTLAQTKSIVFYTKPDGTEGQLTAEQFAEKGAELVAEGAVMDFSDFNIVREGKRGPLFDVAKKIRDARGNEDLFVLTARAPESADAIYEFLKSEGLEFKRENIVGLGNSTGAAKANWIVDKAADGYNDFYFADDAYANVQAVQDALDQIDVKSKVQQAKVKFSKSINEDFNKIIEQKTGIASEKRYSKAKAKVRGANKGNKKFFIPYSAEDFMGLVYPLLSKGKLGDSQMAWFKEHLLDPYGRAIENLSSDRIQMMQDFKELKKSLEVPKDLRKTNDSGFTNEQAVRVYLFNKMGYEVPGLSKTDLSELVDIVNSDGKLKAFADQILSVTKGDGYVKPSQEWLAGTITTDLIDLLNTTKRKKYLEQSGYLDNANEIFSTENLNKLEAAYGAKYREAVENTLSRMKSGKNRMFSGNRLSNRVLDYINGSIGTIMFFNTRSAVLQTISAVNFLNWSFNNPYKAGKAFANQPQYWKDFKTLMNSDYLTDRRNGLKLNISENEIANAAATAKNKARGAMNYILQKGYLPTQIADSFAIASGGATFYRNRINDLVKQDMDVKQAEKQALSEWKETAEISQQSSDPSKISQQQASDLGRVILAFANTPMQYARIQKRAFQDLVNKRGDAKTHVSKIIYYGVVQNLIFNALQQALFAIGFGDDEDEENEKKYLEVANGMLDSTLRGLGIAGATVSIIKNFLLNVYERSGRKRPEYVDSIYELLRLSPPIYSKISKLRQAAWQFDSKKRRQEIFDKGFSLDNPAYEAAAKVISATTNLPLDRVLNKVNNIETALSGDAETWQIIAMLAGWPEWEIMAKEKKKEELPKFPGKKIQFKKEIEFK